MTESIPAAISESVIEISGVKLRCYVLDDGRRLINTEDVNALFRAWMAGAPCDQTSVDRLSAWNAGQMEH